MSTRTQITTELARLDQDMKALEIAYEQYFVGAEKREPLRERQQLKLQLQRLLTSYIPQGDLRFRLQGLSSRFHSYAGHWDRVLRQIDEGRYERHLSQIERKQAPAVSPRAGTSPGFNADDFYEKVAEAHRACKLKVPEKKQFAEFLARQEAKIREKFGDRVVDFQVVTENGKPKIKVRARS